MRYLQASGKIAKTPAHKSNVRKTKTNEGMGARKKMNEASGAVHAGSGTDEEHNSESAQNSARRIDEIFQVLKNVLYLR